MSAGFFKGTTLEQDSRWMDKQKKLLGTMKFPPEYSLKVDMSKVKLEVLKPWITQRVTELLGIEDEVVVNLVFNLLESNKSPDARMVQIDLQGFLERNAKVFVTELWRLLADATQNPAGIPTAFLEKKKSELLAKKAEREKVEAEVKKKLDEAGTDAKNERPAEASRRGTRFSDATGREDRRNRSRSRSRDRTSRRKERSRSRSRERGSEEEQLREKALRSIRR